MNEIIILLDDTLQKIHAREKIGEILCPEQHIDIGNLPIDVDIADALSESRTLAVVLALRDSEFLLVLF